MKRATGPDATYITIIAITTAAIMISMSCAMPIAVTIELTENTRSTATICSTIMRECRVDLGAPIVGLVRLHLGMDLVRRLGDQEQPAGDQDDVVPGERAAEAAEHRIGQPHQPGQAEQQDDAEHQREREPDLARALGVLRRAARHQHRDEHDIVDAEHDLERRQGDERRPGIRIGQTVRASRTVHSGLGRRSSPTARK